MDAYDTITDQYNKTTQGLTKLKTDIQKDLLSLGFFIGMIILIIGFVMLIMEFYMIYKINIINGWPVTNNGATIIDSYMGNSTDSSTYNIILASNTQYLPYYRTSAAFTYRVDNNTYLGDKISYYEPWQTNAIIAKIENDLLQPGRKTSIRINPKNPAEAYILNKPYDRYYRFAFALGVFIVGLFIVISV